MSYNKEQLDGCDGDLNTGAPPPGALNSEDSVALEQRIQDGPLRAALAALDALLCAGPESEEGQIAERKKLAKKAGLPEGLAWIIPTAAHLIVTRGLPNDTSVTLVTGFIEAVTDALNAVRAGDFEENEKLSSLASTVSQWAYLGYAEQERAEKALNGTTSK